MDFKINKWTRSDWKSEFIIQGEEGWEFKDLVPPMEKYSERCEHYHLTKGNIIGDKKSLIDYRIRHRKNPALNATFDLESTVNSNFKRLVVHDSGIGEQVIEKFVLSIEGESES